MTFIYCLYDISLYYLFATMRLSTTSLNYELPSLSDVLVDSILLPPTSPIDHDKTKLHTQQSPTRSQRSKMTFNYKTDMLRR